MKLDFYSLRINSNFTSCTVWTQLNAKLFLPSLPSKKHLMSWKLTRDPCATIRRKWWYLSCQIFGLCYEVAILEQNPVARPEPLRTLYGNWQFKKRQEVFAGFLWP